ncbi:MAG: PAS domain S-box protein [Alphaproteobacteria bacterium]|nr:PAS domain S-box protein [Alphaproteobacteria bacterium]
MLTLDWRLLPVFDLLGRSGAYDGVYDTALVALSIVIASLQAFVALSISGRVAAASSRRDRWAWSCAGAVAMGGGIWAMHFTGMLAFSLPCGVNYEPVGTILSMIPGMLASWVAILVMSRATQPRLLRLIGCAVLMGAGIGTMHYSGMAAMRPDAVLRYDPVLVIGSVIVAVALAFISLGIRFRFRLSESPLMSALVAAPIMGLGIAGMHYTAMRAALFFPLPNLRAAGMTVAPATLAVLIAIFTVLIAALTLIACFAGRQVELTNSMKAEVARREALERDAQNGRARLQAIFDAVIDAIVTIDRAGRIRQWSPGAQRIFGYSAEEVLGADLTMLMPQPHRAEHHRYVDAYLTTGQPKVIGVGRELTAIRRDGSEFPIELTVGEVRTGDELLFTGVLRDITERKRAEQELIQARQQAEAANLAKSQFLATMSHEIRTPMNGVLGTANLLATTPLNERQARLVENLLHSGTALLGLITDILDLSKIEAGRFELSEVDFDPREVIAEVTDLFCERCTSKGLELVYFVAEQVPLRLRGDPIRVRQVLINLVGNAMKFTERGEILIELSVAEAVEQQVQLSFSVEDTGIGIAPEERSQVFEAFHQVDHSTTRARGGSGLGLAICKQLVEMMGGTMSLESELGRGSRFCFTARLARVPDAGDESRWVRQIERPLRVLLIDANAVSAHVTALYMTRWNIDATIVATEAEAEAAWKASRTAKCDFDVAIIDIKGLRSAGIELARRMKSDRSGGSFEIILLIGMDRLLADDTLDALGAFATLTKPVRPSVLFDCLASIASGASRNGVAPFFLRKHAAGKRSQFNARILVVEDNPINQDVATGLLETMGCRTVTAPNGRSALKAFAQDKFDLILMDCEMPVMDGFEATRRIRDLERLVGELPGDGGRRPRIPIIALTAHAVTEVQQSCRDAGMDDFLMKPFDELQMTEALQRWLAPSDAAAPATAAAVPIAAPAIEPALPVVEVAVLEKIRAIGTNGGSLLERVVSQFATVGAPLTAAIRENADAGDAEAVWKAAHSLKSSAAALGARQLSGRCAEIESLARRSGTDPVKPLLDALDAEFQAARQGLEELAGA